ncbi:MAG: hypothetical protein SFV18_05870 [Bryobacteraceae bacterium]|nr:hypothetical protein [Bryobacteraceae bacterium]
MTNTPTRISGAEAERSFSEVLDRIRDKGESFVVERDGMPVCRMTPDEESLRPNGAAILELYREAGPVDPAIGERLLAAYEMMRGMEYQFPNAA